MRNHLVLLLASCFLLVSPGASGGQEADVVPESEEPYVPWILEAVTEAIATEQALELSSRYLSRARIAGSARAEIEIVHAFLAEIPSSHVALFSREAYEYFGRELLGEDSPTPGFQLRQHEGNYHVAEVLAGSTAQEAGLRTGDQVQTIDGIPVERSPRLDLRSDDAHLPDRPTHLVFGDLDETLALGVRRGKQNLEFDVRVSSYSTLRGDRAASRIIEREKRQLGYARLSYMYRHHTSALIRPLLTKDFARCDGLVLDLRGRGGSQIAMWAVMSMLHGEKAVWKKPVVVLVDRDTRSAKEVLAAWFRKVQRGKVVGERTIGAARPGNWHAIGDRFFLLCPSEPFEKATGIELRGVTPDVEVTDCWPEPGDPILEQGIEGLLEEIPGDSPARSEPREKSRP